MFAKKFLYLFTIILALAISGCTSASQIMQSYVGKDLREVIVDYGYPVNAFDMGDGRRAFQWVMDKSYVKPVVVNNFLDSATIITGRYAVKSKCSYTIFARHNKENDSWIIESFRKPRFSCE